jgi:hypothetical protein
MFTKIKKQEKRACPAKSLRTGRSGGFSLIEILLYASGMIVLVSVLILMTIQVYRIYGEVTVGPRVDRAGILTLDKIIKDIRSGKNINLSQSVMGSPDGTLYIVSSENSSNVNKIYDLDNGRITYREDAGSLNFVTPSDMNITKFQMKYMTTPISEGVRVEITITYKDGTEIKTKEFSGFAVLRQSYD